MKYPLALSALFGFCSLVVAAHTVRAESTGTLGPASSIACESGFYCPNLDGVPQPLGIKICNSDVSCASPNGPSLDGLAQPSGIKVCNADLTCTSPNGPSLDGLAQPAGIKICNADVSCASPNGPSLDGLAQPAGIKTCNSDATCQSPNGPSLDGIADDDQVPQRRAGSKYPRVIESSHVSIRATHPSVPIAAAGSDRHGPAIDFER